MDNTNILDIPTEQLTPGMRQYQEAKRNNPDCLIMLRMGDFYEMFYEDAVTSAKELEITLTARGKGDKRAPLAGIPYHALESYLARLIKKGFKVAIIEQLEDPKNAKGLVKRGLVRIVTPGTVIESSMLNEKENNYIMSLTSFADEYAAAFCDLSTGEFFTAKINSFPQLINEIIRLNPSECIIPESLKVNHELIEKIKSNGVFVNSLEDYYFRKENARKILLNHFNLASLDPFGLEDKKSNLVVSGALLKYLLETQKNSLSHIKKISLRSNQNKMLLDSSTLRNLELTKNIKDGTTRGSLLSVFDKTVTAMGARLLKKWIKEPLLKKEIIKRRLNAVEALGKNIIVREEIINLLNEVYDLERLISRVNYGNASPRDLSALKKSLENIPPIKEKLNLLESDLLLNISKIHSLKEIASLINKAIKEDSPLTIREGNIIKADYNEELDQLRDIKLNSKKYLKQIEEREKEKTGIQTLRIGFTRVFGYFIEVTKKNLHLVPETYIRKQTTANSERYITEELKIEEEKILGAEEKINELEYNLFQDILKKVSEQTLEVQETASKLSVLDVLCSLAKVAMENNYSKPEFVDQKVIQIKNGRHPVVEIIEKSFIANDIFLNEKEMMIITGPNMAGKSTVMRQTALIVLMAQMGSFVPAEQCVLGIVDRIFTRVGAYDDLSSGQSTFMVEMNETASILNNATKDSLIILDEIGRGTSTFDGVSIAWSVAEHIYNKVQAKTLFATHYHVMNKLAEKFSKIKNYNIAAKEVKGEVVFLHKLLEGGTDQSYGIHVAKLAGLPDEVIGRAKEIQEILEKDDEMVRKIKAKKLQEQMCLDKF
ncbi:MAG: DNA mismatch repair protein MutS [Nanoarchaeota archaeon]|nr:DNA mismatch repair protein MutS [Nanoarchaeota archaeon]MBU1631691.1 DNA mismatch repair protein MutS [Nanoarchaeota archaeon]MBU1876247.1 DNA mismatch repair protein MutS [Nanoarchaeota archaeon]